MKRITASGQVLIVGSVGRRGWPIFPASRPWNQNPFQLAALEGKPISWVATLKGGHSFIYYYAPDVEDSELGATLYALNDLSAPPIAGLLRGELFNFSTRSTCVDKVQVS